MHERNIEKYLKGMVEAIGGLCIKLNSASGTGYPDRIVINQGVIVFVEVKAPNEKPRALQHYRIKELKRHGAKAIVVDSFESVDSFVEQLKEGIT